MIGLVGISATVPDAVRPAEDFTSDHAAAAAAGFAQIRMAKSEQETANLQLESARNALADAAITPDRVDYVIAVRNGSCAPYSATWLSCLLARSLGATAAQCLDIQGCSCAGTLLGLDTARRFLQHAGRYALVVGGGAAPLTSRWLDDRCEFPDAPPPAGDSVADVPVLLGDGAYAAVVAADGGWIGLCDVAIDLDLSFTESHVSRGGLAFPIDRAEKARWLSAAPIGLFRALDRCRRGSGSFAPTGSFLIGTNSGMDIKKRLSALMAQADWGERQQKACDAQLEQMSQIGHLIGGDTIANLQHLSRTGSLAEGDHLVAIEFGEMFYTSVATLRVNTK
ncbi:MAG: hypothetical protein WDM91_22540 [Rhizomicrobium sp.]